MIRLGCAVRVLGKPGLRPYDARRWQHHPHLTVSLAYLRDILLYLHQRGISFYRMAPDLAPYVTHPDYPEFHRQIEESEPELAHIGALARSFGMRLTFHAPAHVTLSTDDTYRLQRSVDTLEALSRILDGMGLGPDSVIVLHVGGGYDNPARALDRFCQHVEALPEHIRARLALEHDDTTFDLNDALQVHQRTGLPVVFDLLHHRLLNREGIPLETAVALAVKTWPEGVRAKVHLASPSTAARTVERRNPITGKRYVTVHPPLPNQHSDFVHPFDAIALLQAVGDREVDIMVEARAHDVAVARLHADLQRYAPELLLRIQAVQTRRLAEPSVSYSADVALEGDEDERVLVVVVNNLRDFDIIRDEGWYRIPLKHAPDRVGAAYLAFYLTRVFGSERWSIPYIAPVLRYKLARRRDLLPEERDHPRADEWYYKVELGPLRRLPQPVPSRQFRRLTFIPTTLERLLNARDVTDLWLKDTLQEQLYKALVARDLPVQLSVAEGPASYTTGLYIPCVDGGVWVTEESEDVFPAMDEAVIRVSPQALVDDLEETVAHIVQRVQERGGTPRHTPEPVL